MKRVHLILTGLTLTIIALSINRLTPITQSFLQPFEYLRIMDFIAMIPIPLISVLLYYLLKREIVYESPFTKTTLFLVLNLLLISGVYFFAAGSGDHEVTNYLHFKFCDEKVANTKLCQIIIYNDDQFSHIIYYIGFILLNLALIGMEFNLPRREEISKRDLVLISINSLFIALGIFANLAFEEARLDLIFFGSMMLLTLYLLFFGKKKYTTLPVIFYFAVSYTVGVVSTIFYKLLTNTPF